METIFPSVFSSSMPYEILNEQLVTDLIDNNSIQTSIQYPKRAKTYQINNFPNNVHLNP